MASGGALFVAAIDFGTTYSGVAFSSSSDFCKDPTDVCALTWTGQTLISSKGPTSILITEDGSRVDCFGYEAESKYSGLAAEGKHREWYYFRRFKMLLHGDKVTHRDVLLEDATGKELSAMTVFTLSIGFLKNKLLREAQNRDPRLTNNDFHWVLTVPAIWNETAKQFMREAAERAGIDGQRLTIALEPEVASLYCRHKSVLKYTEGGDDLLANLKKGPKYLVLDAGGGTVDITVHCVSSSGELIEVHQASGGPWGGITVDEQFENLLRKIIGGNFDVNRLYETFAFDLMRETFQVGGGNYADNLDEKVKRLLGNIFRTCRESDIIALSAEVADKLRLTLTVTMFRGMCRVNADNSSEITVAEVVDLLRDRIGYFVMKKFNNVNAFDYNDLLHRFELKKRTVSSSNSGYMILTIPVSLVDSIKELTGKDFDRSLVSRQHSGKVKIEGNKLKIDVEIFKDLFTFSKKEIIRHLNDLLQHESVRGCSTIIMVGGFSESELLQDKVRESFPSMKVIIPKDAGLAVLKGAVIFGHNPTAITERICRYTYGLRMTHKYNFCTHPAKTFVDENGDLRCDDIFEIHVRKGQTIKLGEKQPEKICLPIYDSQPKLVMKIYASTEENPVFVTDPGCWNIGQFTIPITGGRIGELGTTFMFGGTEIEVIAEDKVTGLITKHRVEFLG